MTDRYADLRAALDADPAGDKWMCVKYSPKTLGVGISGGPALFMAREGSYTDIDDVRDFVGNLLTVRNQTRALLADYDRMRDALLWNAAALNECCKECIREASNITIESETKCFSEILDMADAALVQEGS